MRRLLLIGIVCEAIYLAALARPLSLFGRFPGLRTDLLAIMGVTPATFAWYVGTFGALFVLYVAAYVVTRRLGARAAAVTLLLGALFAATLMFVYPVASRDFFGYILEARLFWTHGLNPLVMPRGSVWSDPLRPYSDWTNITSSYGPAWILLTGLPLLIGGGNRLVIGDQQLLATFLTFKALAVLLYLGTAVAVYLTVRHLRPRAAAAGTLLYAWNPLVLYEAVANGHNDMAMILFGVLAIFGALKRHWWLAFPCLALAALVKYTGALFAPPLVGYALIVGWRASWRERLHLALGALLGLGAAVAIIAPFWVGPHTFTAFLGFTNYYIFSPYEIATYLLLRLDLPRTTVQHILKPLAFGTFGLVYLVTLARLRAQPQRLLQVMVIGLTAYLLIAAFWFHPWYVTWLVAVAALLPLTRYATLALLFSFTAVLLDAVWLIAWRLKWYGDHLGIGRGMTVLVVFGPVMLYLLGWGLLTVWPSLVAAFQAGWRQHWWAAGRLAPQEQMPAALSPAEALGAAGND